MKKMSALSQLLNIIGQLVIASILWTLCCLPMFTIGPASTALYYAVVKTIRRDRSNILEAFFHAFKTNFWQSLAWNLLLLSYYGVLALLAFLHIRSSGGFALDNTIGILIAFAVLIGWTLPYIYPIISRFFHKGLALARLVLYIGIRYLYVTLIALVLLAVCFLLCIYNSALLIFLPGLYTLVLSYMLEPIFKKLSTDDGSDSYAEWYSDTDEKDWLQRLSGAFKKNEN